jgi:hypothetical protein
MALDDAGAAPEGPTWRFAIAWELFLRASSPKAVGTLFRRFAKAVGRPTALLRSERYWLDEARVRAVAWTPLDATDIQAAVFETLLLADGVADRWRVGTPSRCGARYWRFAGEAGRSRRIVGIEMATFELRNYGYPDEPDTTGAPLPRFRIGDVVRVSRPAPEREAVAEFEGTVSGYAVGDPWSYGVYLDRLQETWSFNEHELEGTGRRDPDVL